MNHDAMTQRVLKMDLDNLSEEEIVWLHKLKNLATAMQARLQLKHIKEEYEPSYLVKGCGIAVVCIRKESVTKWCQEIIDKGGVPSVEQYSEAA